MGNDDTLEAVCAYQESPLYVRLGLGRSPAGCGDFPSGHLLGIDRGRIDNVLILQQHEKSAEADSDRAIAALGKPPVSRVTLQLQVTEETAGITDGVPEADGCNRRKGFGGCGQHMSYQAEITAPDGTKAAYEIPPQKS